MLNRKHYLSIMGYRGETTRSMSSFLWCFLIQGVLLMMTFFFFAIVPLLILAIPLVIVMLIVGFLQIAFLRVYIKGPPLHFAAGDLSPGIVVSMNPCMVAITSDLSMGGPSYPIVKVLELPLDEHPSMTFQTGSRVPMATVFQHPPSEQVKRWVDCNPEPIAFATDLETAVEQCTLLLDEQEWQMLQHCIARLPHPLEEGVYLIRPTGLVDVTEWTQLSTVEKDPYCQG
jgi:hypothetical protein